MGGTEATEQAHCAKSADNDERYDENTVQMDEENEDDIDQKYRRKNPTELTVRELEVMKPTPDGKRNGGVEERDEEEEDEDRMEVTEMKDKSERKSKDLGRRLT